ncbi:MAG: PAS domain-containing protein, partial [Bacteroidota bacterium]
MSNNGLNSPSTSVPPLHEDRLRSILDHQPEMICRFLADTTILFINQAYCDFLRKPAKQLMGKKLCDLLSRSQSRKITENIDSLVHRKKPIKYEHRIMGSTSKITWQIWHYQAIRDDEGKIIEFQSTGRDITALKENQEVVKNSKKNLNAIFNSQNDGLILLDKDMEMLIFNKAFSRFLSNHWERPLEPGHNIKDYIFPEDLSIFITDFDRSLRGEFIVREKQFTTTSGYSLWYEQNFSPVEDDLGNVFA